MDDALAPIIAAALLAEREKALREAAHLVRGTADESHVQWSFVLGWSVQRNNSKARFAAKAADAILALITPEPPNEK